MDTDRNKNKKKVLIFSTAYLPLIGGAEIAVQEITDRLPQYDFRLITARLKKELPRIEQIGSIEVHRIGFGASFDKILLPLFGTFFVLRMLRSWKPDMFWAVMATYASGIPYIVNILRRHHQIPILLTLQEGDSEEHIDNKSFGFLGLVWRMAMTPVALLLSKGKAGGMIQLSWRLALPRSSGVQVISSYLGERARHYGYTGEIALVPNGVDTDRFRKGVSDHERQLVRQSLGVPFGAKILLNVSRLEEKNNVADTITALPHLPSEYYLVIVGEGSLKEALVEQAKEMGVLERVRFVGRVENARVPAYLAIADAFVRTPHSEGLGIAFIEAMAAGVPVIATPVGGIPDFLVDPRTNVGKVAPTGIFAEPGNPESIAEAVEILAKKHDLREKIIADARQLVVEKYDWNRIAEMMRRVFEKTPHI